jgi:hypothetical protein
MKATMKNLFSSSGTETEYFIDKSDKIEVLSCPRKEMICQEQLSVVNMCYAQSEQSMRDKDYHRSIDNLREAFYKTIELVDLPCNKCAKLFRSTITESVEDLHAELKKMTSGLFGNKSYQSCCKKAVDVLNEFEKIKLHDTFKANETKKRFIGNYLKQKVS